MKKAVLGIALALAICPGLLFADIAENISLSFLPSPVSSNLTQQSVRQSFQDSTGALWFVTQEGINRYTGKYLKQYRHSPSNPDSLSSDIATKVAEDLYGNLWVATAGGGLNRYDRKRDRFERFLSDINDRNSPLSNYVSTIFVDSSGSVWLGYKNAFSKLDPRTLTYKHFYADADHKSHFGTVIDFAETGDGQIWAATSHEGLIKINKTSLKPSQVALIDTLKKEEPIRIISLLASSLNLWIATAERGVILLNTENSTTKTYAHIEGNMSSLSSNNVDSIFKDNDGLIWVGTHEGLNLFHGSTGTFSRFDTENTGLPGDLIFSIYQSREGVYWIGTLYGLASGRDTRFSKFDVTTGGLSSNSVNTFSETQDGTLWVGTDDGLNRMRPGQEQFEWINQYTSPGISSNIVMSLLADGDRLWIGTFDSGLNLLNISTNEVKTFRHSPTDPRTIGGNGITSILKTSEGLIVIGTYGGGLSVYDSL